MGIGIFGIWAILLTHLGFLNLFAKLLRFSKILKIFGCDLLSLDLWMDPCLMDISIITKPTYINMDIIHENLSFVDLISHDTLDFEALVHIFGNNLDSNWISNIDIHSSHNYWIQGLATIRMSLASVVYDHLNAINENIWIGWHHVWRLRVISRIKIFIQNMAL